MSDIDHDTRRRFLRRVAASIGAFALTGCDRLSQSEWFPRLLGSTESLNESLAKLVTGRKAMAQEFTPADLSPVFRSNGTAQPNNAEYAALAANGFNDYRLEVTGLVAKPRRFSLADLRALPSRTQITRHDCVEGWSAIGKWQGVPLSHVLEQTKPLSSAKYVVFRCADSMESPVPGRDSRYYESVDLDDAYHVQTVLAYELNDRPLPVNNGAPLRVRIE